MNKEMQWLYHGPPLDVRFGKNPENTLSLESLNLAWWQILWLLWAVAPGLSELLMLEDPTQVIYSKFAERNFIREIKSSRAMILCLRDLKTDGTCRTFYILSSSDKR